MRNLVLFILLGLALAVPGAAAHTTVPTSDGQYLVTVGNLDEPVSTFTKTGLDLIIRANTTQRQGISGAHLTLNATLISPNGQELNEPLRAQFGSVGSYSFSEPYFLTVPGEYKLLLAGRINQTQVNFAGILVGSGPVPAFEALTFPDPVQNQKQLEDRIKALEAEVEALKESNGHADSTGKAPSLDGLMLLGILGVVGSLAARRRSP